MIAGAGGHHRSADEQNGQGNAMWDAPLDSKLWSPVYSLVSGQLTRPGRVVITETAVKRRARSSSRCRLA